MVSQYGPEDEGERGRFIGGREISSLATKAWMQSLKYLLRLEL